MFHKIVISLGLLLLSSNVNAMTLKEGESAFEQILSWENQPKVAIKANDMLNKGIGGLCFYPWAPNNSFPNALVVFEDEILKGRGPAFPAKRVYKVIVSENSLYNLINIRFAIKNKDFINQFKKLEGNLSDPTSYFAGSQYYRYGDYIFSVLRTNKDYACDKFSSKVNDHGICKGEVLQKGSVLQACYYYESEDID